MGGQAVHEQRVARAAAIISASTVKAAKASFLAPASLPPHARPHVGRHEIGALRGRQGVAEELEVAALRARDAGGLRS